MNNQSQKLNTSMYETLITRREILNFRCAHFRLWCHDFYATFRVQTGCTHIVYYQ